MLYYIIRSLLWFFFLVEPGRTPLFGGLEVSVLSTCWLCFMYNSVKVGKCYIVNWITYSTCLGTDEPFVPTVWRRGASKCFDVIKGLTDISLLLLLLCAHQHGSNTIVRVLVEGRFQNTLRWGGGGRGRGLHVSHPFRVWVPIFKNHQK